jgi:hypothetical protein
MKMNRFDFVLSAMVLSTPRQPALLANKTGHIVVLIAQLVPEAK